MSFILEDSNEFFNHSISYNSEQATTPCMKIFPDRNDSNNELNEKEKPDDINNENRITQTETQQRQILTVNENIYPKIENIVSVCELNCDINLREAAICLKNSQYNPRRFSGLRIRQNNPRTTALVFNNGKIVCLGAKTVEDSKYACKKFAKTFRKLSYPIKEIKNFRIVNIVSSVDLQFTIELLQLEQQLKNGLKRKGISPEKISKYINYESELFPGLIYRLIEHKITYLIFKSGKLSIVGAKKEEDIYLSFKKFYKLIVCLENKIKNNRNNLYLI